MNAPPFTCDVWKKSWILPSSQGWDFFLSVTHAVSVVLGHRRTCITMKLFYLCIVKISSTLEHWQKRNNHIGCLLLYKWWYFDNTTRIILISSNNSLSVLIALVNSLVEPCVGAKFYVNMAASHRKLQSKGYIVNLGWVEVYGPSAIVQSAAFIFKPLIPVILLLYGY